MEKDIILNDEGLKVKCVVDTDGNVYFEFDKNYEFLSNFFKAEKNGNLIFVYLGLKKILRIDENGIEKVLNVSMSEVRILRALYENNKFINSLNLIDNFNVIKNNMSKSGFGIRFLKINRPKTESHTSLIQILDSEELIRFLNEYDINYPMNEYGLLDFSSNNYYTYEEVKYNGWLSNLENSIRVNLARNVTPSEFDNAVKNREKLLKLACFSLEEMLGETVEWKKIESDIKKAKDDIIDQIKDIDDNIQGKSRLEKKRLNRGKNKLNEKLNKLNNLKTSQASKILYNELLNISLDKLTNTKAGYSVISFTNDARIEFMSMKHPNDKRFSFLYSIDKDKGIKKFEDFSKSLESLFNTNMVLGADITGFENLSKDEYDLLREKFECILPVLKMHEGSILRIEASNFTDSTNNIIEVLKCIRDALNKINESCVDLFGSEWGQLNPPSIHIAHGVKIDETTDLVSLIKSNDACIEYNLSSNRALKGINDYSKVSLGLYDKHNLKYVFTTDGSGMYYTDYNESIVNQMEINKTIKEVKNIEKDVKNDIKEEVVEKPVIEEDETTDLFNNPKPEEEKEDINLEEKLDEIHNEIEVESKKNNDVEELKKALAYLDEDDEEDDDLFDIELPRQDDFENSIEEIKPLEEEKSTSKEDELEQTLYDIFADFRKDKKEIKNNEDKNISTYQDALEEENLLFTHDGKLLTESEKVEEEINNVENLLKDNIDLDMDYINNKLKTIKKMNENSNLSDNAKMYLFLLEREMFPTYETNLKSIEYLYNNKNKEKNNIERELDRIFSLVTDQYDHDVL